MFFGSVVVDSGPHQFPLLWRYPHLWGYLHPPPLLVPHLRAQAGTVYFAAMRVEASVLLGYQPHSKSREYPLVVGRTGGLLLGLSS